MNYKKLLVKYICHVGASEGLDWITKLPISPAEMGDLEFTEEERRSLEEEIFPKAKELLK